MLLLFVVHKFSFEAENPVLPCDHRWKRTASKILGRDLSKLLILSLYSKGNPVYNTA